MNLQQAISIYAGGPGSGCHGPNCGRPQSAQKRSPEKRVADNVYKFYRRSEKLAKQENPNVYKPLPREMKDWKGKVVPAVGSQPGDKVKLNIPLRVWNTKTGDNDTYAAGKVATVVNVLPKVANADQVITVQVNKNHDPEYMRAQDVTLTKAASSPSIDVQPVPKSQIVQQATTKDGTTVTWIRPQEEAERSPLTLQQLADRPSFYKGEFQHVATVPGADGQTTRVYDTPQGGLKAWQTSGSGTTVWVHRYSDRVVIQEQKYTQFSNKGRGILSFGPYYNIGRAFGMMKQRYGISIPLSKERF